MTAISKTITVAKVIKGQTFSKLAVKIFLDMYRQSTPHIRLIKFIIELVKYTPCVPHRNKYKIETRTTQSLCFTPKLKFYQTKKYAEWDRQPITPESQVDFYD